MPKTRCTPENSRETVRIDTHSSTHCSPVRDGRDSSYRSRRGGRLRRHGSDGGHEVSQIKGKQHRVETLVFFCTKFLQVAELIDKANDVWDRRNAQAVRDGDVELPRMLPLVRLKVAQSPTML